MIDNLNSDQKVSILISGLGERYKSMHVIRERVLSTCTWSLGLFFAAGGWLVQSGSALTLKQEVIGILATLAALAAVRLFLADLNRGFRGQQKAAARIEEALGLYAAHVFDKELTGIYPKKWKDAGAAKGEGRFFSTTYILLYVGVGFLLISLLISGQGSKF